MIKPLGDRILGRKLESAEEKTEGGVIISASSNKDKAVIVEVLEIGQDNDFIREGIIIGSKILIDTYTGIEINYESEKYIIVKYEDILGIVK